MNTPSLRRLGLTVSAACLVLGALLPATASAQPAAATSALSSCLADKTNGKDRKSLARWVFVAMSAHPEISDLRKASDETRLQADQDMAAIMTRLLADDCPTQAAAVMRNVGPQGIGEAFRTLGELAMQEIMTNKEVATSIQNFTRYLDKDRLETVMRAK